MGGLCGGARGEFGCSLSAFFLFLISAGAQRGVSSLSLGKQGAVSWLTNKQ